MKFSEYCDIIRTRGIDELFFIYNDREYYIQMDADNFLEYVAGAPLKLSFCVGFEYETFDGFDELLQANVFEGNTLEEIWSKIEYATFDNKLEENFLADSDDSTFEERMDRRKQAYLEENGVRQWQLRLSRKQSFLYLYKFGLLGAVLGAALLSIPILFSTHWIYMILVGVSVAFALILGAIVGYKNKTIISYEITSKKIFVFNGLNCQTTYDNIRKVTMRKSPDKSGCGVIQIHVRKGLSLNFRMVHVPDVENVYKLIMGNLETARANQTE